MQSLLPVGLGGTQDTTYRFRQRPALQAEGAELCVTSRSRSSVVLPATELPRMTITRLFGPIGTRFPRCIPFHGAPRFLCRRPRADSSFQKSSVSGCLAQGVVAGIYGPNILGCVQELQNGLLFRGPLIQLQHGIRKSLCHSAI
jgi:hypothetical protein